MAMRWTQWSKWYSRIWRMKFRIWSFLFENFCWWVIPMTSSMVASKRVVENRLWSYYLKTRWKFPYFQLWRMLISEFPMSYLACFFTEDYPEVRKLTLSFERKSYGRFPDFRLVFCEKQARYDMGNSLINILQSWADGNFLRVLR